ncbi:hypothetical protein AAZX31_10G166200 [Glycine max]
MASMNNQEAIELFEGQNLLYMQLYGSLTSMCLKWVVQLGIPDMIHNHVKPITLPELVSTLQIAAAKACFVQRIMRFLAHNGIFDIHESQEDHELITYALTPASKLLINDSGHCLSPMLGQWIRGEEDATVYETALGTTLWGLLEKEPTYLTLFSEAMASDSQMVNLALKNGTSVFEELDSIVYVGGGTRTTATIICDAFPMLKCVVFDLPHVVANLTRTNNVSFVGGDNALHDWNDEKLQKDPGKMCKDCISSKGNRGKVIIIDTVINEKKDYQDMTQTKLSMDISMLTINGKEPTEEQWKHLFLEAGFKHYKIFPIFGFRSLIEVYP